MILGFKPCYKWNTFNTQWTLKTYWKYLKSFKPCYKWNTFNTYDKIVLVNGENLGFKPCYKWNTFNTLDLYKDIEFMVNRFTF